MNRRVVILGAGVCGLAAAIRLLELEPELEVTLLEAGSRAGGLARSLTLDGQTADLGPHRIHTELPDVQEFLDGIAGGELVRVERKSRMWLHGRWIEYPPKPLEILGLFGAVKLAHVAWSFAAGKAARLLGGEQPDSFESVMTGAFGTELYRLIALGYTRKVWKVDPRRIHGDIARVRVSAGGLDQLVKRVFVPEKRGSETALKRFYYIPGGVERLVDKMLDRAESLGAKLVTNAQVTDVWRQPTGEWSVVSRGPGGRARRDQSDLLVSTIPVTELVGMLERRVPDEAAARACEGMRFIANFLVCVVVNKPFVTDCQWLYFPGRDTIFNRGYEPKNFSREMGTESRAMIVLEVTCHHGDRIWRASDRLLIRRTIEGLEHTGLLRREEVAAARVHRIPHTYPLYDLEYRRRLRHVWRYLSRFPKLLSAGRQGLFLHNNMDHSIHMGFRAAAVALREAPDAPEKAFYREVRRFQKFRIVD
ncbi:FAD-dependent oxidoreductase [Candidatus Poribacteria bacterium]|nr:FAD-dependent oxidoreductase [Candidatus Poribacteria bacterium]